MQLGLEPALIVLLWPERRWTLLHALRLPRLTQSWFKGILELLVQFQKHALGYVHCIGFGLSPLDWPGPPNSQIRSSEYFAPRRRDWNLGTDELGGEFFLVLRQFVNRRWRFFYRFEEKEAEKSQIRQKLTNSSPKLSPAIHTAI